MTQIFLL